MFDWYFDDNHGPDYYLQSWEIDDDGTTQKFTVGCSTSKKDGISGTASFELTYKAQDYKLAGQLVHYTASNPTIIEDDLIKILVGNKFY